MFDEEELHMSMVSNIRRIMVEQYLPYEVKVKVHECRKYQSWGNEESLKQQSRKVKDINSKVPLRILGVGAHWVMQKTCFLFGLIFERGRGEKIIFVCLF